MHFCLHLEDDVISKESNNPLDFVAQSFLSILGYYGSLSRV